MSAGPTQFQREHILKIAKRRGLDIELDPIMPKKGNSLKMAVPPNPYPGSRRKRKGGKRRRRRGGINRAQLTAMKLVHDRLNPFSRSTGSRIFDHNASPVIPMHLTKTIILTSDSAGHGAVVVTPSWKEGLYLAPTIDGSNDMTALGSATAAPYYSATNFSKYRIVSMGVRITSISAPASAAGLVRIFVDNEVLSGGFDLTIPQQHADSTVVPLYQCDSVAISEPTGFSAYDTHDATIGSAALTGWTQITVSVDGVPVSTDVLALEVCWNYEVFPMPGADHNIYAREPAPHAPRMEDATSKARGHVNALVDQTKQSFIEHIAHAAETAVVTGAGAYVGTKAAGSAAAAATSWWEGSTALAIEDGLEMGAMLL
jgi:hypothetical protein